MIENRRIKVQNFDFHQIEGIIERYKEEKLDQQISRHFIPILETTQKGKLTSDRGSVLSGNSSYGSLHHFNKKPNFILNSTRNNSLNNSIVNRSGLGEGHRFFQLKSKTTLVELQDQLGDSPQSKPMALQFKISHDTPQDDSPNKSLSVHRPFESALGASMISPSRKKGGEQGRLHLSASDSNIKAFIPHVSDEKSKKSTHRASNLDSKGEALKGYLAKMFLGENPALIIQKEEMEKKKQRRLRSAMGTVLGLSMPQVIIDEERKNMVSALDISQKFVDNSALHGLPARIYFEENNFRGMSEDAMGLLVKKSCMDTKFQSLQKAKKNFSLMKDISHYDQRNIRFIKKNLRNRLHAGVVRKAYDLVNDEKYTIKLEEEYKRRVYDEELMKDIKKAQAEKAALDLLAGKKEEVQEVLSPAKKLQRIIYEHRYVEVSD